LPATPLAVNSCFSPMLVLVADYQSGLTRPDSVHLALSAVTACSKLSMPLYTTVTTPKANANIRT
jgi:hypothetical protein